MDLSFFIRDKKMYASLFKNEKLLDARDKIVSHGETVGGVFVKFLSDLLREFPNERVSKIVVPYGPASFTTLRVIISAAKGFAAVLKLTDIVSVSTFIPYYEIAKRHASNGAIAIPTKRGDYFTALFDAEGLGRYDVRDISADLAGVFFESDEIFDDLNLSVVMHDYQMRHPNSNFIKNNLEPFYGFTPQFKF